MRRDLTLIWRVSNAALCSRELGEIWVRIGEHGCARSTGKLRLIPHPHFALSYDFINLGIHFVENNSQEVILWLQ